MKAKYKAEWFKEAGAKYQVQFAIMRRGALYRHIRRRAYKRGYRPVGTRTCVTRSRARQAADTRKRGFYDPFCGSGTIPVEAALAALNRAPGINRKFAAQKWKWLNKAVWSKAVQKPAIRSITAT